LRIILILFLGFLLSACSKKSEEAQWQPVPLPKVGKAVELRVVSAVNPRFPAFTQDEIRRMLAETAKVAREHFGVELQFTLAGEIPLTELFDQYLVEPAAGAQRSKIYDFKRGTGDREKLIQGTLHYLQRENTTLDEKINYAQPYLLAPLQERTELSLAAALVDTQLARLKNWQTVLAADGKPVIDDSEFNEYMLWDVLGYAELPWDIIVTNQLVASAEYTSTSVHSAIRGGITGGSTGYSRASPYKQFIFWSTFLYSDDSDYIMQLRKGARYSRDFELQLSGAYLAHEIGHMLFQFGHPLVESGCVMTPVELLDFLVWYERLDPDRCPVGGNPQMRPGVLPVEYNPAW
jgi:hypothetical protein